MKKKLLKLSLIIIVLFSCINFTSCASFLGYNTTKTKLVHNDKNGTNHIIKSIALPSQFMSWWDLELYSFNKETIDFGLNFQNPYWLFIDNLEIIIDGHIYSFEDKENTRETIGDSAIRESVYFEIPVDLLKEMSTSYNGKINFIGFDENREFKISDNIKNEFKDYLNFLDINGDKL
ncbi:MAG: hypothetical protein ACPKOI_02280 [Pleomorphochaeta sp.]